MQKPFRKRLCLGIISQLAALTFAVGLCAELALPQAFARKDSTTSSTSTTGFSTQAKDPGVRGGASGAGGAMEHLTASYGDFFTSALAIFAEVDSVSGTVANEPGKGLGPRFNSNSCSSCHAFPATGGSSPLPIRR
jgi:CxxC motif-containing protein (DUF1111 family)